MLFLRGHSQLKIIFYKNFITLFSQDLWCINVSNTITKVVYKGTELGLCLNCLSNSRLDPSKKDLLKEVMYFFLFIKVISIYKLRKTLTQKYHFTENDTVSRGYLFEESDYALSK